MCSATGLDFVSASPCTDCAPSVSRRDCFTNTQASVVHLSRPFHSLSVMPSYCICGFKPRLTLWWPLPSSKQEEETDGYHGKLHTTMFQQSGKLDFKCLQRLTQNLTSLNKPLFTNNAQWLHLVAVLLLDKQKEDIYSIWSHSRDVKNLLLHPDTIISKTTWSSRRLLQYSITPVTLYLNLSNFTNFDLDFLLLKSVIFKNLKLWFVLFYNPPTVVCKTKIKRVFDVNLKI